MAAARRKAVCTQPMARAPRPRSRPMLGNATLTDDPMNGVRNDAAMAIRRTDQRRSRSGRARFKAASAS